MVQLFMIEPMGSIWEFWVVFEILTPSNTAPAYPQNLGFWPIGGILVWCCMGWRLQKNHPELLDTTHRFYHKLLDHFDNCFVHIFEENLIIHFFSLILEGKTALI